MKIDCATTKETANRMKRLKKKSWKLHGTITGDRSGRHEPHTGAIRRDSRNIILPPCPYPALIFCTVSAAFDPICQYNRNRVLQWHYLRQSWAARSLMRSALRTFVCSPPTTTYLSVIDNYLFIILRRNICLWTTSYKIN